VVDGERRWRLNRVGVVQDVPPDVLADDLRWYAGHVYRTIHRVAAWNPALGLAVNASGRLEVREWANSQKNQRAPTRRPSASW
jgi:hypothetical protein